MIHSTLAITLVVGASLGWAGLDLCRKLLAGRIRTLPLLVVLSVGQLPAALVWMALSGGWSMEAAYLVPGLASALLNVVANVAYLRSVELSPLSSTVPLLSLGPVFTAAIAVPLLGQRPGPLQLLGILSVVAGALILNSGAGGGGTLLGHLRKEPGAPLMMLTALLWSLTLPLDRLAIDRSTPAVHMFVLSALVAAGAAALGGRRADYRIPKGTGWMLLLTVAVGSAALVLQLLAIRVVMVALVETFKRGLGCLAAVALGRFVLGEGLTPQKVASVVLMVLGVALVLL